MVKGGEYARLQGERGATLEPCSSVRISDRPAHDFAAYSQVPVLRACDTVVVVPTLKSCHGRLNAVPAMNSQRPAASVNGPESLMTEFLL